MSRAAFTPAGFADPEMGAAADDVAAARSVTRQRQDAYAQRSHRLAVAARAAGVFEAELVAVRGVRDDDRPRERLTLSTLGRLRPAFTPGGSVTAGNSCAISDGAAAVAVVSERQRAAWGVPGLAVRGWAAAGVDPRWPALGPVPAAAAALTRAGVRMSDVGVLEITEAFAAQVLACTDAWGLEAGVDDRDVGVTPPVGSPVVCPQGGAIALGHPWGASGTLLLVRLFAELVRQDPGPSPVGLATCAIGGGQGVAMVVERVG